MSAWRTSPRTSASLRLSSVISRTLSSFCTPVTPKTRSAAVFAERFSRKLPTVPRSVTVPSWVPTAIDELSILGSQKSSSETFFLSSSFDSSFASFR
jgi:hypothetical protein